MSRQCTVELAAITMLAFAKRLLDKRPPGPTSLIAAAFVLLVPLYQWTRVELMGWSYGGSRAAQLDALYFCAVLMFRTAGAVFLAALLLFVRKPAALWIVITATWLSGPPITLLLAGIYVLSASLGQTSVPSSWTFLGWYGRAVHY